VPAANQRLHVKKRFRLAAAAFAMLSPCRAHAQGIVPPGAGPITRAFGGTAVGVALDVVGSLYWNPATLSFLRNRLDMGAEATLQVQSLESSVPANAISPGVPAATRAGRNNSDDGLLLAPSLGFTLSLGGTLRAFTLGAGLHSYSGGGSNYPADPANPTLAGLGGWYNYFVVLAMPVAVAAKLNEHLSVAVAADFAQVTWLWSRAVFAAPNTAVVNGATVTQFPPAVAGPPKYGIGAHLGAFYHADSAVSLGVMVKSPIWFQKLTYNTSTFSGGPRSVSVNVRTPMYIALGASYNGIARWLFAADAKYALYENKTGFYGKAAFFNPDGSVHGLGYKNGWAFTGGTQYKLYDKLNLLAGYKYSTRVIDDATTSFQATSARLRHAVGPGAVFDVTKSVSLAASYVFSYGFPLNGPVIAPTNRAIPGSNVRITLHEHAFAAGATIKY
jgi:long-chain fatty acid transport protein